MITLVSTSYADAPDREHPNVYTLAWPLDAALIALNRQSGVSGALVEIHRNPSRIIVTNGEPPRVVTDFSGPEEEMAVLVKYHEEQRR